MKEISIEQKAKRYDEAIAHAKKILKTIGNATLGNLVLKNEFENMFPELKESEDERIRKALLNYIYDVHDDDEERARWADWLEKQAEYLENYDEAEKEKGDYVGNGLIRCRTDFLDFKKGNTYRLEYVGDDKYIVRSDNLLGKTYHITPRQLYTVFKKLTWLEKQGDKSDIGISSTTKQKLKDSLNKALQKETGESWDDFLDEQNPASEIEPKFKQGDIIKEKETGNLFYVNSVEEFGYTLHYKNCIAKGCTMDFKYEDNYELVEQNSAWSEEDEKMLECALDMIEWYSGKNEDKSRLVSGWLKSLKDRVQPQPKQEWSEEDKKELNNIIYILEEYKKTSLLPIDNQINWLKSIKDRFK